MHLSSMRFFPREKQTAILEVQHAPLSLVWIPVALGKIGVDVETHDSQDWGVETSM